MPYKSFFRERDVLTPEMRERMEAFYARIDRRLAKERADRKRAGRAAGKEVRHA